MPEHDEAVLNTAKRCFNIILAIALLCFPPVLQAVTPGRIHIGTAWLAGNAEPWTVAEVAARPARDFIPIPAQGMSLGFRDDRFWLRMTLENAGTEDAEGWLDLGTLRLTSVVLYQPDDNTHQWTVLKTGLAVPVPQRALQNRGIVFPIQLKALEKRTVYVSIASNMVITLQPSWWGAEDYRRRQEKDEHRDLLLFGAMLGLAGFGLFQALVARDLVLALNGLRALCFAVWGGIVMGYVVLYLRPEAPGFLLPTINVLTTLFLAIQMLMVALFLPPSHYPGWLRYLFFSVAAVAIGVGLAVPWIDSPASLLKGLSTLGLAMQLAVFYACFITAWRGFYPAWWLLCGYSFAVFGMYRRLAEAVGWIAPSSNVDFMALLNAFISTLFFYLGTAARVDRLRNER